MPRGDTAALARGGRGSWTTPDRRVGPGPRHARPGARSGSPRTTSSPGCAGCTRSWRERREQLRCASPSTSRTSTTAWPSSAITVTRPAGAQNGLESLLDASRGPSHQAQGDAVRGGQLRRGRCATTWWRSRPPATRSPATVPTTAACRRRAWWSGCAQGALMLEDLLGVAVHGFRSPRFDVPGDRGLVRYRDELAEAGYRYVSDAFDARCPLTGARGARAVVARGCGSEGAAINVCCRSRRSLPPPRAQPGPAVLYYHSYDFDEHLARPGCRALAHARPATAGPGPHRADRMAAHRTLRKRDLRPMSPAEFDGYFHDRASRFAAFYRSEGLSRLIGRGPLFDRLARAASTSSPRSGPRHVLDVGCGSGPLFAPLATLGVRVTGLDPAPAMVALARVEAGRHPDWSPCRSAGGRRSTRRTPTTSPSPSGVFDYVDEPGRAAARHGPRRAARRRPRSPPRDCGPSSGGSATAPAACTSTAIGPRTSGRWPRQAGPRGRRAQTARAAPGTWRTSPAPGA